MSTIRLNEKTLAALRLPTDSPQTIYWDSEQTGFGVVVGKTGRKTFIVRGRVAGERYKKALGVAGAPRDQDGHVWTVQLARIEARKLLGQMADGKAPVATRERVKAAQGPTLRDAIDLHLTGMARAERQLSSVEEYKRETTKHLADWMDRALATITRTDCRELHEKLTKNNGKYVANRVMRYLRCAWNTALKEHDLMACPTIAVQWNKEHRRQEPVPWAKLPDTYAKIEALESGLRRDYYLTLLFTGLRKMDAASIRWAHVNTSDRPVPARVWNAHREKWEDIELPPRSLLRPNPKGGAERAFSLPLPTELVAILDRRRRANATIIGGDAGWAFPTTALGAFKRTDRACHVCLGLGMPAIHAPGATVHAIEPREDGIPSPHRWRDTYTTACAEVGLSGYAIDVLTNHRPPKGSVTAGYIDLGLDYLAGCQQRVTDYLLAKAKPEPAKPKATKPKVKADRAHLRAV